MTSYADKGDKPEAGLYIGFDHIEMYVSNAMQAASFYITRFGFKPWAYRGLETGNRQVCTRVVRQGKVVFAFSSALEPGDQSGVAAHVAEHGDGVKVVGFLVDDCAGMIGDAVKRGAEIVEDVQTLSDGNGGTVVTAVIKAYGDTVHRFVQRDNFDGPFMPGFRLMDEADPLSDLLESPDLKFIDHVVGNMPDGKMVEVANWYERVLQFHRFWSVDDKQLHTEYSSLRSIVMADYDEVVKTPINEPAAGKRKSQIQEYVDYYGGAGVQHIALCTTDILRTISILRKRGVDFLSVPKTYYEDLHKRLASSPVNIKEDLEVIEELNILVDFDDAGYLLQLFTKPIEDRPTLFLEIIQRNNHQGFGAGNFKSLFEAIERHQAERGNLV